MREENGIRELDQREDFYTKKLEEAEAEAERTDIRFSSGEVLGAMRAEIVKSCEEEKDRKNALYMQKLERGLAQIRAGKVIVKTMEELKAMEGDEPL